MECQHGRHQPDPLGHSTGPCDFHFLKYHYYYYSVSKSEQQRRKKKETKIVHAPVHFLDGPSWPLTAFSCLDLVQMMTTRWQLEAPQGCPPPSLTTESAFLLLGLLLKFQSVTLSEIQSCLYFVSSITSVSVASPIHLPRIFLRYLKFQILYPRAAGKF